MSHSGKDGQRDLKQYIKTQEKTAKSHPDARVREAAANILPTLRDLRKLPRKHQPSSNS